MHKNWHRSARSKAFVPGLDREEGEGGFESDDVSMSEFSVAAGAHEDPAPKHTRRTDALYLEAHLRQARKEQMTEHMESQGPTFQPKTKWGRGSQSNLYRSPSGSTVVSDRDVVDRLYDPSALEKKERILAAKKQAQEERGVRDIPRVSIFLSLLLFSGRWPNVLTGHAHACSLGNARPCIRRVFNEEKAERL